MNAPKLDETFFASLIERERETLQREAEERQRQLGSSAAINSNDSRGVPSTNGTSSPAPPSAEQLPVGVSSAVVSSLASANDNVPSHGSNTMHLTSEVESSANAVQHSQVRHF